MQRIGRVDRRMDSKLEDKIKLQYPHLASKRGIAKYWNFLPPDELNEILSLYQKVTNKTLRISKVFGIEGKQLLTEKDDYDALKDFEHEYEGETSKGEEIKLKYQKILIAEPLLEEKLNAFPLKVFSGKEAIKADTKGGTTRWSLQEGITSWYFYSVDKKVTLEDFILINEIISCNIDEPRIVKFEQKNLVDIQKIIKNHIINNYYKASQVPVQDEEGNSLNPVLLT